MVKDVTPIHLEANILKMAGDSDLVTVERLTAYGESNGHVLDAVTYPVFLLGTDYILSRNF